MGTVVAEVPLCCCSGASRDGLCENVAFVARQTGCDPALVRCCLLMHSFVNLGIFFVGRTLFYFPLALSLSVLPPSPFALTGVHVPLLLSHPSLCLGRETPTWALLGDKWSQGHRSWAGGWFGGSSSPDHPLFGDLFLGGLSCCRICDSSIPATVFSVHLI